MRRILLSLMLMLFFMAFFSQVRAQNYTISGYISNTSSGESLIGATIYIKDIGKGITTNVYGFYSLSLPIDTYKVSYSYLGYETVVKTLILNQNTIINVRLNPTKTLLKEVVVSVTVESEEEKEVKNTQMSMVKIPVEEISEIPSIGGETDVIKMMQLMPGVKQGVEGSTGMYVRGGDNDQNLIMLDEAIVYNVSHLFGFFSVFNADALKDVTLIKGGFPANYGGRLSSVLDIRMKEGNMQKLQTSGGIGVLSSRLTLEGPLKKGKSSFIISGRRTYIDQVFKLLKTNLPYYFYDLNTKFNYKISDNDRLYLSSYIGDDVLRFKADLENSLFNFKFILGNFTTSIRWNHLYNSKLFSNFSIIHTRFRYDVEGSFTDNSILIKSAIQDIGAKADFDYYSNPENHFTFGLSVINHRFRPYVVSTSGEISGTYQSQEGSLISTQELALYGMNEHSLTPLLKLNYGVRNSFAYTENTLYPGIEPRVSLTYLLSEKNSVKASYSRMKQYMHLVSSSSITLPTDLWYPVTKRIKPQKANQFALSYTRNIDKIKSVFSIETYYKWMQNLIEYREGAVLILNNNYEDELVSGSGDAYGTEFFIKKNAGKLHGWIGYTLSWSKRYFPDLNKGKPFFAKYDRRHDISIVASYNLFKRISIAAVWVYGTGARITPMIGQFFMPNASLTSVDILPIYTEKNAVTFPASHRLDINLIYKSKNTKKWQHEWQIGGYNVYNQTQPFIVTIETDVNGSYKYQAKGLFGFIPSISYNFKF